MNHPPLLASVARRVVFASCLVALPTACSTDAPPPEALVTAPLVSCLPGDGAALACDAPSNPNKAFVCHSTGSAANRYVMIEVNASALGNAHVIGERHGRNQLPDLVPGTGGLNCNCQPIECTNICAGAANGTSCQDDPCNQIGQCQTGVCVSQPKDCSGVGEACYASLNACADGVCLRAPKTAGTSCADADLCDGAEKCDGSGTCAPGTPPTIDDGDACTIDACAPASGVSHTPVLTDDGNACTVDACDPTTGESSHTPVLTDDGNACTVDACDPTTGESSHTPVPTDDGNACTVDACDPATGESSHTPVSVDDTNACTDDACDPITGVSHTHVETNDANACTDDACDPATGVSHKPVATDDFNACTDDACDPATGVSHKPVATNDGTPARWMRATRSPV